MDALSDDEFYEARDEISSRSGSDSADEEASDLDRDRQDRSKPPRHDRQQQQWFSESRFSVWQDGPKSIQERRRLLYERFGILGRRDERAPRADTSNDHEGWNDRAQIRVTRFGIREHVSPARKGFGRGLNSSVISAGASEFSSKNEHGSISRDNVAPDHCATARQHARGSGESSKDLAEVESLTLGRSRSDSSALALDGRLGNAVMTVLHQIPRSASTSPQHVPGIERLTQTSGAVLREGKLGPSSLKPPIGSRASIASKSAPSSLHNLAGHVEKIGQSFTADRPGCPPNTPNGLSAVSPTHAAPKSKPISEVPRHYEAGSLVETDVFHPHSRHLASRGSGGFDEAMQIADSVAESNQDEKKPAFRGNHDFGYKIKDLDSGKEFIIDGMDGDPKLRELDTGKELTLDEFESSLGLSPLMQEVRRREREKDKLDEDDASLRQELSSTGNKKKKKSLWVRTMKGVAKTVGSVTKTKSQQDPSKAQSEGSRGEVAVDFDRDGSVGNGGDREESVEKGRRGKGVRAKSGPHDTPESLRHRSPRRVKVQAYKKNFRDLSDLNMGQEIQAHQGAIWTMKFSLDGRYLASAGQDRVVHVWEVIDHPFSKDPSGMDGLLESTGHKGGGAGNATPEHSQHSQESSQGRRGSLRGSVGKRKTSKSHSSSKLPKLFWLSETALCSFKGHSEDVLDLSWSRNQFLLSSSMDKTVRLWHISYGECLRIFTHSDYVTCIEFSPTDDRYFLSGSLDDKVRIWSITDHQVVDWSDVREMVTAASYSPDGKRAVIGTYRGTCRFYNTTGHKLQLDGQVDVKSAPGKKARGKKITGLQFVPGESNKVLVTSNDSRIRIYDGLELSQKFKGLRNINSQISATFSRTGEYIVSASEDSRVYIWNSGVPDFRGTRKDKPQSYEHFPSSHISIAIPWPGMDPQSLLGMMKEDSELHTSRDSGKDEGLRSPLRCSPCSSSSSRSNGSTHSESGLTSESVGECKSEQSITYLARSGSGGEVADEEVTSRRTDANSLYLGSYDKPETPLHISFRESPGRDYTIRASASSPAFSLSNDSPLLEQSSLRSPSPSFFPDITPKGSSATWPEEKLPPLHQESTRSRGGSWSASSPSQEILSTELSPAGSTASEVTTIAEASWGLVIVTASLGGEIRTFQNYGYPIRL